MSGIAVLMETVELYRPDEIFRSVYLPQQLGDGYSISANFVNYQKPPRDYLTIAKAQGRQQGNLLDLTLQKPIGKK